MMQVPTHLHYLPLRLAVGLEELIESDHLVLIVLRVLGASIADRHHIAELSTNEHSAPKLMIQHQPLLSYHRDEYKYSGATQS